MPIAVTCGRCKKQYTVDDGMAGKPVQCKTCRYVMVIPSAADGAGAAARGGADLGRRRDADAPPPPREDVWQAAAADEQAATATEAPIVIRRHWWDRFRRRESLLDDRDAAGYTGNQKPPTEPKYVAMALVPVLLAAVLLYVFVPWRSILAAFAPAPARHAEAPPDPVDTGPAPVVTPEPVRPTPTPAPVDEAHEPVPVTAPRWAPDPKLVDAFGPYVAFEGFALRGPVKGLHVMQAKEGGITWIGVGHDGPRPFLLLNVTPATDRAQRRPRAVPGQRAELGWVGAFACARTQTEFRTTDGSGTRAVLYNGFADGKHVTVRIQVPSSLENQAAVFDVLESAARTLRPAEAGDVAVTSADQPPHGYDPAENPPEWEADDALLALLAPAKSLYGYTIRPPQGLRVAELGIWCGHGAKLDVDGYVGSLPLLHVSQKPLESSHFATVRAWADDQWWRLGREAEWGLIGGYPFARTRYEEVGASGTAVVVHYAGVVNDRFFLISTAAWAGTDTEISKQFDTSVRTFKPTRAAPATSR